jgi:hypothetical protein
MKTLLKSAMLFFALVLTNSLTFAAAKVPEVYISESPVSDLSGAELLNTAWFWILIIVCVVVFISALIATKDEEHPTHFPEHSI